MQFSTPQILRSHLSKHTHILQQKCINTNLIKLLDHLKRIQHLILIDDSIHCNMNLCSKLMSIITQLSDIFQRIACCCSCTKTRCTNIYGICTMINGSNTTFQVLGRRQ